MTSFDEIVKRMTDQFTSLAGYSPDDASDIGIRIKVLAGEVYSLCSAVDWLKTQTFAQSAQGEQLDLRAQERGLTRKQPVAAQGALVFGRTTPLWYSAGIPLGTVCSTAGENPVQYITTQEAILPQGELSVTVPAKAEQGGRAGNTQPGTVTIMMTPPPAMESVTNSTAFIGGEDSEGDSQLRSRLMQSYAGFSNGTNISFYREFALKYDGVYSAGVVPRESGAGTVGVYLGGRGGVPPQDVTSKVQNDLNEQREINVTVTVAAAQTVPVNIDITVTPAQYVTMEEAKSACAQAVTDYFNALSVGEPVILAALGVPILATGKIKNYVFTSSVTTDRKMNANQLAVCGTMNIMCYAEES